MSRAQLNLHEHIAGSFRNGLSYDDAVQLCRRLYSSVDGIAEELHSQCTKDNLALIFSHLVAEGVVIGEPITSAIYGANFHAPNDKGHWIEVIASNNASC